ncbi:hypothetical protein J6590_022927 [Homalodisca vitripennis]|nr:hypothetical protein J6590_022927 [Homalodisca vitripennis]
MLSENKHSLHSYSILNVWQEEIDRKRREEEEAERRRIEEEEAARALLKQQRKEAKKAKKKKKALAALAVKTEEQGPQMVTIKRVMEPNCAEPTVTITLRGATPNEDKVLYTLLNGQVQLQFTFHLVQCLKSNAVTDLTPEIWNQTSI